MSQFFKFLSFNIFLVLVSGCASMKYNDLPPSIRHDFPAVNEQITAYVGDAMLIQGRVYAAEILILEENIDKNCYYVPKGTYVKVGSKKNKKYFDMDGSNGSVHSSNLCDPIDGIYVSENNADKICLIGLSGVAICYEAPFSIVKRYIPAPEIKQKTLYFSGLKYNRVHFLYTERIRGITIHSHEVSYDMNESQTIGYKGARIKILNATNENIIYEVLANFPERSNIINIEPVKETSPPDNVQYY